MKLGKWICRHNLIDRLAVSKQVLRPECTISWNFQSKLMYTCAVPVVVALFVALYVASARHLHRCLPICGPPGVKKKLEKVQKKMKQKSDTDLGPSGSASMQNAFACLSGSFTLLFPALFKTMLQAFDCTGLSTDATNDANNAIRFLDVDPKIKCDSEDPEYRSIISVSSVGLFVAATCIVLFVYGLMTNDRHHNMDFIAAKMQPQFFYWELILMCRKILLMVVLLYSTANDEAIIRGWVLCIFILIGALCLQVFAQPYRDPADNLCELLAALGNIVVLISGMAFRLLEEDDDLSEWLIGLIIAIGIIQTFLCLMVQGIRFLTDEGRTTTILLKLNSTDCSWAANAELLGRLCHLAENRCVAIFLKINKCSSAFLKLRPQMTKFNLVFAATSAGNLISTAQTAQH